MPRKRNDEPAPDSAHFRLRIDECAEMVRSPNALAVKAGIPPSTLTGYRSDGREPPRPDLIAIAAAAGVAVGWLVDGKGPKEAWAVAVAQDSQGPKEGHAFFREQLARLAEGIGGFERLAECTGITIGALNEMRSSREPSRAELVRIAEKTSVRVDWLLQWSPDTQALDLKALFEQTRSSALPIKVAVPGGPEYQASSFDSVCGVVDLLPKLNERFADAKYKSFGVTDDRMEPTLKLGDVVIFREQSEFRTSGIYLIQGVKFDFVARAEVSHDGSLKLTYDNPVYRLSQIAFDPDKMKCLGRVVSRLTSLDQKAA